MDPQKDVASIEYGFGDGSPPSQYWAHTYTAPGTYTLTVTVVATDRQRATATTKLIVTA